MKIRAVSLALILVVGAGSTAYPQTPQGGAQPSFEVLVVVKPRILDFNALVLSYFELRTLLQAGLPVRRVTDNPEDNIKVERALARRVREARNGAVRGDIFTPAISDEFRSILQREMDPSTLAVVMDDNPGLFAHRVNGSYPKRRPLS